MKKLPFPRLWRVRLAAALTLSFLRLVPAVFAAVPQTFVTTPDGISIAVQEYGNPAGKEIVFVHGLAGSHLNWTAQIHDPALAKYRLITYDLRGHGSSSKPTQAAYYTDGKRWGDELHAVLEAKHLKRPTLVGWSLGGPVITNYLAGYGDRRIAGLVFVDGIVENTPELITPHPELAGFGSEDLGTYLQTLRTYVALCFFHQPSAQEFELLYANAARATPDVLRTILTKGLSLPAAEALPKLTVPVLYLYGEQDALLEAGTVARAKALIPHVRVVLYPDTGHALFQEQSVRFDHDLADAVEQR